METSRSVKQRFLIGYIPYTFAALIAAFLLISVSKSWGAVMAGGILFVLWAAGIAICQLVILFVPYVDKINFHAMCILITLGSMLLGPALIAIVVRVVPAAIGLAA